MLALLLALQTATADVPPPPPPQPIADCFVPGPFIVFFDRDAAKLDAEARDILTRVAEVERTNCSGPFRFTITGHTDRGERAGVDLRRAATVRAFVVAQGLGTLAGLVRAAGSSVPRVLAPGRQRQNQRVEIEALF